MDIDEKLNSLFLRWGLHKSDSFKFIICDDIRALLNEPRDIPCQRCVRKPTREGCATCGGYRVVLQRVECPKCHRAGYGRPGVFTTYVGKEWRTIDGMGFVQLQDGAVCDRCADGGELGNGNYIPGMDDGCR